MTAKDLDKLIKDLEDEDMDVRYHATDALELVEQISDAEAVEPLIKALGNKDMYVSRCAARALGKTGDKRAVEPLIKALGNKEDDVRECAAEALGEIGDKRAVDHLLKALEDEKFIVRKGAMKGLGNIGDKRAVEPLIGLLYDDDFARDIIVDSPVAEALGNIGDKRAVEPLIKALEGEEPSAARVAAEALGLIGDARAVEPLIKALVSDWSWVRCKAAEALEVIGDVRAVEPLIRALEDEDDNNVRYHIANALVILISTLGEARAMETLIGSLGSDEKFVRQCAVEALGKITEANVRGEEKEKIHHFLESDDPAMVMRGASLLKGTLVTADDASPENLQKFLESDDQEMRGIGLSIAKDSGMPEEMLQTILKIYMWDKDKSNNAAAKSLLAKHAPVDLQATLKENWKPSYRTLSVSGDKLTKVIEMLIEAFGTREQYVEVALHPLINALGESNHAAEALGRIGEPAIEPLIRALQDWDGGVRNGAAEALGKIGDARAVEPLIKTLKDSDEAVHKTAVDALGSIGDTRAVEPLLEMLNNAALGEDVRCCSAGALGQIGDARAVDPLIKVLLYDRPSYFWEAAVCALGNLGDERAINPLTNKLNKLNGRQGCGAIEDALNAIGKPSAATRPHSSNSVPKELKFESSSSPGTFYTVSREGGSYHCTCPGFKYRQNCNHIKEVVDGEG